ncbi:MAG: DegV family protein [Bacillota bacterium]|nr:DegV family protein [Bacillota bacterium]
MGIRIVTDSSCDLWLDYLAENKDIIEIAPSYITLEESNYLDDYGVANYNLDEFYHAIRNGKRPSTAMVTPGRFQEIFMRMVDEGDEILYVGFSSAMSSVHDSAIMAKRMVLEERPDAVIHIIDTGSASLGLGMLIIEAVKRIRAGKSSAEIAEWIESVKRNVNHWFGVDSLGYLKAGGRISPAVAVIGTALNMKPTLTINTKGQIVPAGTVRGRKKSISLLADKAKTLYDPSFGCDIYIVHGDAPVDAAELARQIREALGVEPKLNRLNATIATHVGPGTMAVVFMGKERSV